MPGYHGRVQGKPLRLGIARVRQRVWNARRRLRLVPRNNVTYNRELWDRYSRNWDDPRFRKTQIDPSLGASANPAEFEIVGEEWAPSADVDAIVAEFIEPFVSAESTAVEIGVGGGRIAERVAPMVALLVCLDISARMLERANVALAAHPNVEFGLLDGARLPPE